MKRGFVKEGETPLEVAAQQLIKDGINGEYCPNVLIFLELY